jgi:hypothetical protein
MDEPVYYHSVGDGDHGNLCSVPYSYPQETLSLSEELGNSILHKLMSLVM